MTIDLIAQRVVGCTKCPELAEYRATIARDKRRAYRDDEYWAKPVPAFGDTRARVVLIGLAPGAHGSNRTGRMFTGDASGDWLYRALYKAGVANTAKADSVEDRLVLKGVLITAIAHCAPPDNKPLPSEIANCRRFLAETLGSRKWKSILCLG